MLQPLIILYRKKSHIFIYVPSPADRGLAAALDASLGRPLVSTVTRGPQLAPLMGRRQLVRQRLRPWRQAMAVPADTP